MRMAENHLDRAAERRVALVDEHYRRPVVCVAVARKRPRMRCDAVLTDATPGQAGPPAEFKHINKRRKRNLRGFP